jgi:hypothetical protein
VIGSGNESFLGKVVNPTENLLQAGNLLGANFGGWAH